MEKRSCLIIFEKSMVQRFSQMAELHDFDIYSVGLDNNLGNTILRNIYHRIKSKKLLKKKKSEVIEYLKDKNYVRIYFSNAEGYISKNFIPTIQKAFPNLETNALQHGVFLLKKSWSIETWRLIVNTLGHLIFGVYPLGAGFGGVKTKKYYVYSDRERNYLISKMGWNPNHIIVDMNFIKVEVFEAYLVLRKTIVEDKETAIMLLQGLSSVGICTPQNENFLIQQVLDYLSESFVNVLVKEHPACPGQLLGIKIPKNVLKVDDLFEGFAKAGVAYSFFSTALIDAKVFNLETVGIISRMIKVDRRIYDNFDRNINFDEIIAC